MQAGFALVETGLIRAKNASHSMSMNFAVYALGMFGFFVCGFAFMCGGLNGTAFGGSAFPRGTPTLSRIFTRGSSLIRAQPWGRLRATWLFLRRHGHYPGALLLLLFLNAFMDTTA